MVVAVGFIVVEPLADVDVNVPGVMATLVAPAATQLSVLLVPAFMLVGLAVNEVIVGTESFPEDELDELVPQPSSPSNRMRTNAQRPRREEFSLQSHVYVFPKLPLGVDVRSLNEL